MPLRIYLAHLFRESRIDDVKIVCAKINRLLESKKYLGLFILKLSINQPFASPQRCTQRQCRAPRHLTNDHRPTLH
jgi:hypothetical protein